MGDLVTPWLHALSEHFGEPIDVFAQLPPDLRGLPQYTDSGLYLWRQAVDPQLAGRLTQKISPIVQDIYATNWSKKTTAMSTYKSFQATSSPSCSCKYNYTSAANQVLYHRGGCQALQPPSVTMFLDEVFDAFEIWGFGTYPMIKTPTTGDDLCVPREFNLIVVNEYDYTEKADSYIPWHDDNMYQSCRNDMDTVLTPVISISLGVSAVFAVMPNKDSLSFYHQMLQGYSKKWTVATQHMKGRLAFLLHHGDILLMTGQFQKSFQHKTWKRDDGSCRSVVELTKKAEDRNYSLILSENDQTRLDKQDHNSNNKRYVITGRHIHYHDRGGDGMTNCPLMRLPRNQHERLTTVDPHHTMVCIRHDSLLASIPASASLSKRNDVRNKLPKLKAKSPAICLKQKETVKIEYVSTTRPAYDDRTCDKASDSDSDVPMSPENVFEKTLSFGIK
jgi:hypothetical protein